MSISIFILLIVIFLIAILISKKMYQNVRLYQKVSNQVDFLPNPSPFIMGHIWLVLEASFRGFQGLSSFKSSTALARTHPFTETGLMWGWIGNPFIGLPFVVSTRSEVLKSILGSKQRVDKGFLYFTLGDIFGKGLINSDKITWTKHRKLLNPTFHQKLLHNFVPAMNIESRKLLEQLQQSACANKENLVENVTSLISHRVMAMLLGTTMALEGMEMDPKFLQVAEDFDHIQFCRLQNPLKLIKFLYNKTSEGEKFYQMVQYLRDYASKLLRMRMDQLMEGNNNEKIDSKLTLLDTLIEEHVKDPNFMTKDAILDEFITFLAAGWDTTTWTATFTLQLIGQHSAVQEKIVQELDAIVGDTTLDGATSQDITMEDVAKMKYLECVINETLRLYPLINIIMRHLHEDLSIEIDNQTRLIPAGTEVIIDPELIHRSPKYWKDPDRFDPDRFLASSDRDPLSFIPFSFGPRNCIGKQFAMIEEKIMLTHILRRFHVISVDPIDKIRVNMSGVARRTYEPIKFILKPRGGVGDRSN